MYPLTNDSVSTNPAVPLFAPRPNLWCAAEPPRLPLRRELSSLLVFKGLTEGEITRGRCLYRGVDEHRVKSGHLLLLLHILSAFTHTRCISPSVCLLKSLMQASTSLLRGRRGRSRAAHRFSSALPSAGRYLPLFFCNQKKSRKTVKEKFLQPPPSRSRVRLPLEKGE